MSDFEFEIFNKLSCITPHEKPGVTCQHIEVVHENGLNLCTECGLTIDRPIMFAKDWTFYGAQDTKRGSDPNRVHARKIDERGIRKDVETMGFSESIISAANAIYAEVTGGSIFRGGSRKAIIFACVFHAYKAVNNHQTPDALIRTFGITRKAGLKGLRTVNINLPTTAIVHSTSITPEHIIDEIMDKFAATDVQKEEVHVIYKSIYNRSSKLNRARPQSVAASVVYYWIEHTNGLDIPISEFATTTELSELTISKNLKEIVLIREA